MTRPPPDRETALRDEYRRNEAEIAALTHIRDAERLRTQHQASQRHSRLMFSFKPDLLAGACAWYRRTDRTTAEQILSSYRRLLKHIAQGDPDTGLRPIAIDFAALAREARPYLVPAFVGLAVGGRYPELSLQHSNPEAGRLVYVHTSGPATPSLWQPHIAAISAWLGGDWELIDHSSNTITLSKRTPLPRLIPFRKQDLKHGHLFCGYDVAKRAPIYLPLAEMTAGTLLVGASGRGKSVALHCLLQSLMHSIDAFDAIYLVDGKDGVELAQYARISPKLKVLWDDREVYDLMATLNARMRRRQTILREHNLRKLTSHYIGLVIDETSTYTLRPSSNSRSEENKAHAQFIDDLARIARRGRSAGIRCLFACQEPTDNQIPTTVRNNCDTVIGFQLPIDAHATAVFGQLEKLPADPRRLPTGRALIREGMTGSLRVAQFPVLTGET